MGVIRKRPSKRLMYVQVSADRILLRRVATGAVLDEVPVMAVDNGNVPAAIGRAAIETAQWRSDVRLMNGFSHPRCLIGDVEIAALTLRLFVEKLLNPGLLSRYRARKLDMVIHPVGVRDLSGLEAWGLKRIGAFAGARRVRIWLGEDPPYETLISGVANSSGTWLIPTRL